jgi:hypothetical protein
MGPKGAIHFKNEVNGGIIRGVRDDPFSKKEETCYD